MEKKSVCASKVHIKVHSRMARAKIYRKYFLFSDWTCGFKHQLQLDIASNFSYIHIHVLYQCSLYCILFVTTHKIIIKSCLSREVLAQSTKSCGFDLPVHKLMQNQFPTPYQLQSWNITSLKVNDDVVQNLHCSTAD